MFGRDDDRCKLHTFDFSDSFFNLRSYKVMKKQTYHSSFCDSVVNMKPCSCWYEKRFNRHELINEIRNEFITSSINGKYDKDELKGLYLYARFLSYLNSLKNENSYK